MHWLFIFGETDSGDSNCAQRTFLLLVYCGRSLDNTNFEFASFSHKDDQL